MSVEPPLRSSSIYQFICSEQMKFLGVVQRSDVWTSQTVEPRWLQGTTEGGSGRSKQTGGRPRRNQGNPIRPLPLTMCDRAEGRRVYRIRKTLRSNQWFCDRKGSLTCAMLSSTSSSSRLYWLFYRQPNYVANRMTACRRVNHERRLILISHAIVTLWCPSLPYGHSYKASCASQIGLSRHL